MIGSLTKLFAGKAVTDLPGVRGFWLNSMLSIAGPVLEAAARDQLRAVMPMAGNGKPCGYLEALGRIVCGIAPWLENKDAGSRDEERLRGHFAELTRQAISHAVDPRARDAADFRDGTQPLVDAAFLAQGLLRARMELWEALAPEVRNNVLARFRETRDIRPWRTNWLLFSALIETFLANAEGGGAGIKSVIDYGVAQFEQWYVGDGQYKDGASYHCDYYNSIVIHPLLWDVVKRAPWVKKEVFERRFERQAAVLERMIASDGSWPIVGRSITYRVGVFHALAAAALEGKLGALEPAQVRCAMTAALRKMMSGRIFTKDGWLALGCGGTQPSLAEPYINTGSLYMCMAFFLPLGLPGSHPFWAAPDQPWTAVRVWRGDDCQADKAL